MYGHGESQMSFLDRLHQSTVATEDTDSEPRGTRSYNAGAGLRRQPTKNAVSTDFDDQLGHDTNTDNARAGMTRQPIKNTAYTDFDHSFVVHDTNTDNARAGLRRQPTKSVVYTDFNNPLVHDPNTDSVRSDPRLQRNADTDSARSGGQCRFLNSKPNEAICPSSNATTTFLPKFDNLVDENGNVDTNSCSEEEAQNDFSSDSHYTFLNAIQHYLKDYPDTPSVEPSDQLDIPAQQQLRSVYFDLNDAQMNTVLSHPPAPDPAVGDTETTQNVFVFPNVIRGEQSSSHVPGHSRDISVPPCPNNNIPWASSSVLTYMAGDDLLLTPPATPNQDTSYNQQSGNEVLCHTTIGNPAGSGARCARSSSTAGTAASLVSATQSECVRNSLPQNSLASHSFQDNSLACYHLPRRDTAERQNLPQGNVERHDGISQNCVPRPYLPQPDSAEQENEGCHNLSRYNVERHCHLQRDSAERQNMSQENVGYLNLPQGSVERPSVPQGSLPLPFTIPQLSEHQRRTRLGGISDSSQPDDGNNNNEALSLNDVDFEDDVSVFSGIELEESLVTTMLSHVDDDDDPQLCSLRDQALGPENGDILTDVDCLHLPFLAHNDQLGEEYGFELEPAVFPTAVADLHILNQPPRRILPPSGLEKEVFGHTSTESPAVSGTRCARSSGTATGTASCLVSATQSERNPARLGMEITCSDLTSVTQSRRNPAGVMMETNNADLVSATETQRNQAGLGMETLAHLVSVTQSGRNPAIMLETSADLISVTQKTGYHAGLVVETTNPDIDSVTQNYRNPGSMLETSADLVSVTQSKINNHSGLVVETTTNAELVSAVSQSGGGHPLGMLSGASGSCSGPSAVLDPRLRAAWRRCLQGDGSLEPLLKEELRLKIMKRRLDNGEDELTTAPPSPSVGPPEYQMTSEDLARRAIRRDQNKGAAKRFRLKKRQKEVEIRQTLEQTQEKNRVMSAQVLKLRRQVSLLRQEVERHRHCADCRLLLPAASHSHSPDETIAPPPSLPVLPQAAGRTPPASPASPASPAFPT